MTSPRIKSELIRRPRNLENYFLNVVNKARAAEAETSGATSGNKVAAYLRAGAEGARFKGSRLLERLSKDEPEQA